MPISISNQQDKLPLTAELKEIIIQVAETIINQEGVEPDLEVAIVLVDDEAIQSLNRDYRDIDSPTDVLSFAYQEDNLDEPTYKDMLGEEDALGDIIISLERAKWQAEEYGHSLKRELGFLVAHGMYHLLGYDHLEDEDGMIMQSKEEQMLTLVGLSR